MRANTAWLVHSPFERLRARLSCVLQGHDINPEHDIPADVASPPLQMQPLIVSGPSRNRVDLVFFSDGCKSLNS